VTSSIDQSVSHSARIWNYWLGGKDNFEIDRQIGDQFAQLFPDIVPVAKSSRQFLSRAVTHLTTEAGIRQFLDIGTGLPTVDNTHEVAQRAASDARVVYVDNDPMVLTHARALLTGTLTSYIDADLHDPDRILAVAAQSLDLTRPVALILMNILGHVPEASDARRIVARLMSALPSGSHLVVADGTNVIRGDEFEAAIAVWNASGSLPYHLRTPDQILEIIGDLDLLEPGIVPCPRWRPATDDPAALREVDEFGLVARKR
jgi:O-methyltransferase involved in polyketide biosynthesis